MSDPFAPMLVVAVNGKPYLDPAVDMSEPTEHVADENALFGGDMLERYRETRDRAELRIKVGATPVEFVVSKMPAAVHVSMRSLPEDTRHWLSFLYACHEIRGSAKIARPRGKLGKANTHGMQLAPDSWINDVSNVFGAETVMEIGAIAYKFAGLPEGSRGPF